MKEKILTTDANRLNSTRMEAISGNEQITMTSKDILLVSGSSEVIEYEVQFKSYLNAIQIEINGECLFMH